MGAIESTEAGNFWDNTLEIARNTVEGSGDLYYRDEESYGAGNYYNGYGKEEEQEREELEEEEEKQEEMAAAAAAAAAGAGAAATAAEVVASPARREGEHVAVGAGKEEEKAKEAGNAVKEGPGEITSEDAAQTAETEVSISKSQKLNQVAPQTTTEVPGGGTKEVVTVSRVRHSNRDIPFAVLFIFHLVAVTTGILYLNVVFLKDITTRKLHNLERWFPQLGAAVAVGSLFAALCQTLFRLYPQLMVRSIVWTSSFLTFGASLMLFSTSSAGNFGVGILCLIFSICQSIYACWISSRLEYAGEILSDSLHMARSVPGTYLVSFWVLLIAAVWTVFWSFGVVSALSFRFTPLIILALLATLAWTLETLRNVVCTVTARGVAVVLRSGHDKPVIGRGSSLHSAFTTWLGSICLGSLIVPMLHTFRVVARGMNRIHGENEFMFSCAGCFAGVMDVFARYANNWAYAQVAIHDKAFVQASQDTYDLFRAHQLNIVIDKDLTSSFCVLSGISGGMLCVLVSGGWTFGTHKALTSSVSVIAFFIGYFLVRIPMAVPQGAVCAHYVCAAENPRPGSPIFKRLEELQNELDIEKGKRA